MKRATPIYLIDGNNVAFAWRLAPAGRPDRAAVEARVDARLEALGGRGILVFDGPPLPDGPRRRRLRRASVPSDADAAILARAKKLAARQATFTVVTSDKPLLERARRLGARTLRAHEFRAGLGSRRAPVVR